MDLPKLVYLFLSRDVGVRVLRVPNKCYVPIHSTYAGLHAQDGLIFAHALEIIIKYNVSFLEPAMSLERIRNNTEDDTRNKTVACEKFEHCEGIEQAEIGSRIKRAKILEFRYQSRGMSDTMHYGGQWNAKSAPFNPS
jgi:hypothetical protein